MQSQIIQVSKFAMILDSKSTLLIVGGGRWARVIVSVLIRMKLPFDKVVLISKSNKKKLNSFLSFISTEHNYYISVFESLDDFSDIESVGAAIVANSARMHFETASYLLRNGVSVLVEKPIVLNISDAEELISKASGASARLVPSLQYSFCSYLYNFKHLLCNLSDEPVSFSLNWSDAIAEERYGEKKSYDHSLNIAQDVMPHIWTILATVFDSDAFTFETCEIGSGGRLAYFEIKNDQLSGKVHLERDACIRKRLLEVKLKSGKLVSIDFAVEPGHIKVGDRPEFIADSLWGYIKKPLENQLSYFIFNQRNGLKQDEINRTIISSVIFCDRASSMIKKCQQKELIELLCDFQEIKDEKLIMLREFFADELIRGGAINVGDNAALEKKIAEIVDSIIKKPDYDNPYIRLVRNCDL
jgi:hypothetical protein